jgi:Tol biopolymer transport system component
MMKIHKRKLCKLSFLSLLLIFVILVSSCNSQHNTVRVSPTTPAITNTTIIPTDTQRTPTKALEPKQTSTNPSVATETSVPTSRRLTFVSPTFAPTPDSTQQTWYATAVTIQETERAESQHLRDEKETQIAQFSVDCEYLNTYSSGISPDGKWFAASCEYKRDQTLIVQDKEGTKWILEFEDFLNVDTSRGIMGAVYPKFWSPEGEYLYFTIGLGYDGGGNYCFPTSRGDYGLFRLNLKTGLWSTQISSTNSFPGYEIEFSPTGRHYAVTMDGVVITDLQTGDQTSIETNGVIETMKWSPDGKYLAYSVASCDEERVISSSVYVWDTSTNHLQKLFEIDGIILKPKSWIDNSTIRIIGEEIRYPKSLYTIYEYDLIQESIIHTNTATPSP